MHEIGYLKDVIVVLLAAVIFVPLFHRIKLGPVLGYLCAGMVIGPYGLELITDSQEIRALAKLGVVFLLFSIGLELPIDRIKVIGGAIFALGIAQIGLTTLAIAATYFLATGDVGAALLTGGALALSSTAVVLRLLSERREITNRFGRSAVAVLLIQDLAFGPMLVLALALEHDAVSPVGIVGFALLKGGIALAIILFVGRLILRPLLFHPVASSREPEIVAALTFLTILCIGLSAQFAGLSMEFGAFLAGILLAETNYRHQVAGDIEPVRGLFLGLFFMTVGMSINLLFARDIFLYVVVLALSLLAIKGILIAGLCRLAGFPAGQSLRFGAMLSQGGEFGFVLLGVGIAKGIVDAQQGQLLITAVAFTMMATPLLALLGRQIGRRIDGLDAIDVRAMPKEGRDRADRVVIAGFGRVGATVARFLRSKDIPFVAIDLDPARINDAHNLGYPVFYGDATRPDILDAVGAENSRAVVVALDHPKDAVQLVTLLHYIFPRLKVIARARDDSHVEELRNAGANIVVPEYLDLGERLAALVSEESVKPKED